MVIDPFPILRVFDMFILPVVAILYSAVALVAVPLVLLFSR